MSRALTLSLAAVLTAALAAPASGAPKKNTKSPEQTAAYWTAERIKNAKPRERARPGGGGGGKLTDWTAFQVPLPYAGVDQQNGKLFMTFADGNYVCSGTAVQASSGVNLVWTAGHCVTDGIGKEATNLTFIPAYAPGTVNPEPFGRWTFIDLDSTDGWEEQGSDRFTHDVGALRVQRATAGTPTTFQAAFPSLRSLSFTTRTLGERFVAYGYPAAGKFNGTRQHGCASPFRRWDDKAGEEPMQISCNMTGGSSGGAWFLDSNANNRGDAGESLISVNSYGYPGEKNTMYGPHMGPGSQAQSLYTTMSGPAPD